MKSTDGIARAAGELTLSSNAPEQIFSAPPPPPPHFALNSNLPRSCS